MIRLEDRRPAEPNAKLAFIAGFEEKQKARAADTVK